LAQPDYLGAQSIAELGASSPTDQMRNFYPEESSLRHCSMATNLPLRGPFFNQKEKSFNAITLTSLPGLRFCNL